MSQAAKSTMNEDVSPIILMVVFHCYMLVYQRVFAQRSRCWKNSLLPVDLGNLFYILVFFVKLTTAHGETKIRSKAGTTIRTGTFAEPVFLLEVLEMMESEKWCIFGMLDISYFFLPGKKCGNYIYPHSVNPKKNIENSQLWAEIQSLSK